MPSVTNSQTVLRCVRDLDNVFRGCSKPDRYLICLLILKLVRSWVATSPSLRRVIQFE